MSSNRCIGGIAKQTSIVFKQENPCGGYELGEQVFWPKSAVFVGPCFPGEVLGPCEIRTMDEDDAEIALSIQRYGKNTR